MPENKPAGEELFGVSSSRTRRNKWRIERRRHENGGEAWRGCRETWQVKIVGGIIAEN
jgi:hypothetical protein